MTVEYDKQLELCQHFFVQGYNKFLALAVGDKLNLGKAGVDEISINNLCKWQLPYEVAEGLQGMIFTPLLMDWLQDDDNREAWAGSIRRNVDRKIPTYNIDRPPQGYMPVVPSELVECFQRNGRTKVQKDDLIIASPLLSDSDETITREPMSTAEKFPSKSGRISGELSSELVGNSDQISKSSPVNQLDEGISGELSSELVGNSKRGRPFAGGNLRAKPTYKNGKESKNKYWEWRSGKEYVYLGLDPLSDKSLSKLRASAHGELVVQLVKKRAQTILDAMMQNKPYEERLELYQEEQNIEVK